MYGAQPRSLSREPVEIEMRADCPTCGMPAGKACVLRGYDEDGENTGDPHNRRGIAAERAGSRPEAAP